MGEESKQGQCFIRTFECEPAAFYLPEIIRCQRKELALSAMKALNVSINFRIERVPRCLCRSFEPELFKADSNTEEKK